MNNKSLNEIIKESRKEMKDIIEDLEEIYPKSKNELIVEINNYKNKCVAYVFGFIEGIAKYYDQKRNYRDMESPVKWK